MISGTLNNKLWAYCSPSQSPARTVSLLFDNDQTISMTVWCSSAPIIWLDGKSISDDVHMAHLSLKKNSFVGRVNHEIKCTNIYPQQTVHAFSFVGCYDDPRKDFNINILHTKTSARKFAELRAFKRNLGLFTCT